MEGYTSQNQLQYDMKTYAGMQLNVSRSGMFHERAANNEQIPQT